MRKLFTTLVAVGALAAGTASATTLGTFNDVTFAATDIDLADCTATDVDVLPSVPTVGVTDVTFGVESVRLVGLDGNCAGKLVDISFIGEQVVEAQDAVAAVLAVPATFSGFRHTDHYNVGCMNPEHLYGHVGPRTGPPSGPCDATTFTVPIGPDNATCHYDGFGTDWFWIIGDCSTQIAGTVAVEGVDAVDASTTREVLSVERALLTGADAIETLTFDSPLALDIEQILDVEIVVYDDVPAPAVP